MVVVSRCTRTAPSREFTLVVGQPLVQNGGFETGDFSSWVRSGDFDATRSGVAPFPARYDGDYSTDATDVHSGQHAASLWSFIFAGGEYLDERMQLIYLSQDPPTVPGMPYVLSFWLQYGSISWAPWVWPDSTDEFRASWNGNTVFDLTEYSGPSPWTNIQLVVTATGTTSELRFGVNAWTYFDLDDVSLTPLPAPAIQSVTQANSGITFTWSAVSGRVYQVQYTPDLTQPNWTNLGASIPATNSTASASDAIGPDPRRYYRVVLLP